MQGDLATLGAAGFRVENERGAPCLIGLPGGLSSLRGASGMVGVALTLPENATRLVLVDGKGEELSRRPLRLSPLEPATLRLE